MNGDGRRFGHRPTGSRALAWRCPTCLRLTIRMDREGTPALCDHGCGPAADPLEQVALRETRPRP